MNLWMAVGFAGQVLFASRFLVQIVASERQRRSLIPVSFWYLSMGGALLLLAYAISIRDPVFILGQSTGFVIYLRNLWLIRKETIEAAADAQ
ncbi:MAG: hypothetical protein CVV18_02795 [Gammaproteobacteria bacterium HGW-Gammaproteobacteria-8]|nr:MAG: hypothetical protein CVV18_02795 [Gammaproteobacteria bacterium HGW-Gammaproteobacteria-8]